MKYGIFTFPTEYSIRVDQLARAVEERGFESLWLPEHTHIPVQRRSPYPAGGALPRDYFHIADPFVGLAAAAAVTKKIKLGTAICLVIEHDPIVLAKKAASLDFLSGGRFIFGIGTGWNAEEMENHGTVFRTRYRLLRERIEAIKRIWCDNEPEYHGQFVNFDRMRSFPKPVHKPHPPIFFGGDTPLARQRVVDNYDGWTYCLSKKCYSERTVLPQQEMLLGAHLADNRHCLISKAGALVCAYNCTLQVFMGRTASAVRRLDAGKTQ